MQPGKEPASGLRPGSAIGAYEILSSIGAGGMGEVYRARDSRLRREVAIKVLPEGFAADPDRLARFTREAQFLAALNHPNIAGIYGVEDGALVMELVEGPTLAERIAAGRIPFDEAMAIARQVAEALEYAHEKGIIHRDLKPANIKLTPEGRVKLLDFGLAKAMDADSVPASPVSSPTLTMRATMQGVILGTAAYMSPEQARGAAVDRRADLWAFGVVLFEMLAGRQLFNEESVSETLAAVLKTDLDWSGLPSDTPAPARRLLRRCLQRDRRRRLRDAGDALLDIEEALAPTELNAAPRKETPPWRAALPWALAAVAAAIAVATAVRAPSPAPLPVMRWTAVEPSAAPRSYVAISPDGSHLSYLGVAAGFAQIFVRAAGEREAKSVSGRDSADFVAHFYSPDSRWIAYRTRRILKKVAVTGGAPITVLDGAPAFNGGAWGPDGRIILGNGPGGGLARVSADGGNLEVLTKPDAKRDETLHDWPSFLPGGEAILFAAHTHGPMDNARIEALVLRTGERRTILEGGVVPRYAPSGHLIYTRGGTIFAVPFDARTLQVKGSPVPVVDGLVPIGSSMASYSFSQTGDLVYMPEIAAVQEHSLVWVDRNGGVEPIGLPSRAYSHPSISPDGSRVALNIASDSQNSQDIWIYDLQHRTLQRRTYEGSNVAPIWTPDGKRILFRHIVPAETALCSIPADGSGMSEKLLVTPLPATPSSFTPDGTSLIYYQGLPLGTEAWILPLAGDHAARQPRPLIQPAAFGPQVSPDGRWVAYGSVESGGFQVYVQPYSGPGGKFQISVDSGQSPRWARNGRELFYRNGEKMMAVDIQTQPTFSFGTPRVLFTGKFEGTVPGLQPGVGYDVSPDGKRFLMVKADREGNAGGHIEVVHNWFEELRRRVPPGK